MTKISWSFVSAILFLLGSLLNVAVAIWTVRWELGIAQHTTATDESIFQLVSCAAAACYLLDVALDEDRRTRVVAVFFAIGAVLELVSTILEWDWMMLVAVHSYLVSAGFILLQPPESGMEGVGDVIFALGCGLDVLLSYLYWNDDLYDVLIWGDVVSSGLWFLNACVVLISIAYEEEQYSTVEVAQSDGVSEALDLVLDEEASTGEKIDLPCLS